MSSNNTFEYLVDTFENKLDTLQNTLSILENLLNRIQGEDEDEGIDITEHVSVYSNSLNLRPTRDEFAGIINWHQVIGFVQPPFYEEIFNTPEFFIGPMKEDYICGVCLDDTKYQAVIQCNSCNNFIHYKCLYECYKITKNISCIYCRSNFKNQFQGSSCSNQEP